MTEDPPGLLPVGVVVALLVPAGAALVTAQGPSEGTGQAAASIRDPRAQCDGRIPHPPIRIAEDEGPQGFIVGHHPATGEPIYRPGSGVIGGQGTPENPYIIAGWCIRPDAASNPRVLDLASIPGIGIGGTDAHVVIRDNVIPGGNDRGMRLDDTGNVTLTHNVIRRNDLGVSADELRNASIIHNTVTDNRFDGIVVQRSDRALLVNNTVTDNRGDGVELRRSIGSHVANNTITDNRAGVVLRRSRSAIVQENTLDGDGLIIYGDRLAHYHHTIRHTNTDDGEPIRYVRDRVGFDVPAPAAQVILANTTGARVDGLDLSNTSIGLQGGFTENTTVTNTTLTDNDQDGINLRRSTGAYIANNTITDNRFDGIDISSSSSAHIGNNTIKNNGIDGVRILQSSGAVITQNIITGNGDDGVGLIDSNRARIANNTVADNSNRGAFLRHASSARIIDNDVQDNEDDGVFLWGSTGGRIADNTIESNDNEGILLDDSTGARIANNTIAGNRFRGVILFDSERARIADNLVTGNGHDGVFLWSSSSTLLTDNDIQDNGDAGLLVWGGGEPVDATDNWWDAPNGPSGGVTDACTGEVADGDGNAIDTDNEHPLGADGEVCFDPWRTAPNPDAGAS